MLPRQGFTLSVKLSHQPHILDCNRRLIGKRREERDVLLLERFYLAPAYHDAG
jgi:hypothetical protein